MSVALRFGRNLASLEFTSDITNRATRIAALNKRLGGLPTYLGAARWVVVSNTSGVIELADPAGGAAPVAFDDQFNAISAWYLYRESTAQAYAITDSAKTPNTVTITGDPGIAAGEFVQFRNTATAGTPIAVGPGGAISSLSRGYIQPILATAKSTNTLTLAHIISFPSQPTADGQYVGDDVAFSNFVQTSVVDVIGTDTYPNYTLAWVSGTDFSGIAVGDWLITGDLSVWENAGGSGISLPPMTVTAVTDSTHIEVTIRGAGPSFNQGAVSVPTQFFRPNAGNLTGVVTASNASANTVTVDDATGVTASPSAPCALEFSYTPVIGRMPYYLEHPTYAAAVPTGIGPKFGTIDRQDKYTAVANLAPNAVTANWTAGVPDGYTIVGSGSMTQNTDPLYTQLGGSSILVALAGGSEFRTPTIAWRPAYQGQRLSVRVRILIPDRWSGNLALEMRLGIVKSDGSTLTWFTSDPTYRMVPPDYANALSTWAKPAQGAWFDGALPGFDITTATSIAPLTVRQSDLADAVGYFVSFVNISGAPPFYFDGIAITPTDVAVDAVTEFGEANRSWQDVNVALGLIAKPLPEIQVDAIDLYAMNPDASDVIDQIDYPGSVLAHMPDIGLVNEYERIIEHTRTLAKPGEAKIVLGTRQKRYIDFFLKSLTALQGSVSSAVTALQSGGNPSTNPTPPTTGGSTGPTLSLTASIASDVPTASGVVSPGTTSYKIAGSTSGYPDEATVEAETASTTFPVSKTFASISPGQTEYLSGFAYDLNGVRSPMATTAVMDPVVDTQRDTMPLLHLNSMSAGLSQASGRGGSGGTNQSFSATGGRDGGGYVMFTGNGSFRTTPGLVIANTETSSNNLVETAFLIAVDLNSVSLAASPLMFAIEGGGSDKLVGLWLDTSGHVVVKPFDNNTSTWGAAIQTSTFTMPASGWQLLEVHMKPDNTSGDAYLIVREVTAGVSTRIIDIANVDMTGGGWDTNADTLLFGSGITSAGSGFKFCNYAAFNRAGFFKGDYIGDAYVGCVMPTGTGTYSQSGTQVGSATRWQNVDEIPANDATDYNQFTADAQRDTFTIGTLSTNATSILGVSPFCRHTSTSGSGTQFRFVLVSNGTVVTSFRQQGLNAFSTSWLSAGAPSDNSCYLLDPHTSAAWTKANAQAVEVGVERAAPISGTNVNGRVTQVGLEYLYRI